MRWNEGSPFLHPGSVDYRLAAGSAARDKGAPIFGVNDDFSGKAPDLGACEADRPLPHYGPSWVEGDFDFTASRRPAAAARPADAATKP